MLCACYAISAQEVAFALSLIQAPLPLQEVNMVTKMGEIPHLILQRSQTCAEVVPVLPQNSQALTHPKHPGEHLTTQIQRAMNQLKAGCFLLCSHSGKQRRACRFLKLTATSLLELQSSSSAGRTFLRKSVSAPDLSKGYQRAPDDSTREQSFELFDVFENIHAVDCNITYADDGLFRDILRSYFTWDHPYQRFFDEEAFLQGLAKSSSELASDLLTNAVIMYGAVRSFVYQFLRLDIRLILYSETITLLTPTWMALQRIQHSLRPRDFGNKIVPQRVAWRLLLLA